jgi:hypothetical protein
MRHALRRGVPTLVGALALLAALAPAAGASIAPSITLNQSGGTTAGSTTNLGLDLKFSDSGTDSPRNLTIDLPPGLLADASIDGGACLRTKDVSGSVCQLGSGTVTATADPVGLLNVPVPVSVPVSFYLVPPPAGGDLAGLAVEGLGEQIGSTGDIRIRPTGDPDGVGVTLGLVLPDELPLTLPIVGQVPAAQISLTEIDSTFDGLRYPATCPSAPARLSASVSSYADPTVHIVSAPLSVTGCSALSYAPVFKVTANRDSADRQVNLATTITQTATQAPSRSVSLNFPAAALAPNLASIEALCLNVASGTCDTVGSATAMSPLYPSALSGKAYLTGSMAGLSLTVIFPSPFPLTLTGAVNLVQNSANFTGLPDIPLTNLAVSLDAGADGLFLSTCQTPSGTATADLTDQNGDRTAHLAAQFTVAGCRSTGGGSGGTGSGAGGGSAAQGGSAGTSRLTAPSVSGLGSGHPSLTFTVSAARRAAKLTGLTVALPAGLSFVGRLAGKRLTLAGVSLRGVSDRTPSLSRGRLVISLRRAVSRVTVRIGSAALHESAGLAARIRTDARTRLRLTVTTTNVENRRATLHVSITVSRS